MNKFSLAGVFLAYCVAALTIQPSNGVVTTNSSGECTCPREPVRPVCGSDGITYSNRCSLDCAAKSWEGKNKNLHVKHDGECQSCICPFDSQYGQKRNNHELQHQTGYTEQHLPEQKLQQHPRQQQQTYFEQL